MRKKWFSQAFYRHRRVWPPLLLQRACATDLRAAVIRGFKNVDVYKTHARIIICASSETTKSDIVFTSLPPKAPEPHIASYVWGMSNTDYEMLNKTRSDDRTLMDAFQEATRKTPSNGKVRLWSSSNEDVLNFVAFLELAGAVQGDSQIWARRFGPFL